MGTQLQVKTLRLDIEKQGSLEYNSTGANKTLLLVRWCKRLLMQTQLPVINTAIGYAALGNNTTGSGNLAVGRGALGPNTTGEENLAIGQTGVDACSTGLRNTGVGYYALSSVTTASDNTTVGSIL